MATTKASPYLGLSQEERAELIARTETEAELDEMWLAWERYGFSGAGILQGLVLKRKTEIGVALDEGEAALLKDITRRSAAGAKLPAIKGRRG